MAESSVGMCLTGVECRRMSDQHGGDYLRVSSVDALVIDMA